jgi:hypothetical protein
MKFVSNSCQSCRIVQLKMHIRVMSMCKSCIELGWSSLQSISRLVPIYTNRSRIFVTIWVNYLKTVNEHLNYTKAIKYSARIARINVQFDREISSICFDTKLHHSTKLVQLFSTICCMDFQSEVIVEFFSPRRCQGRSSIRSSNHREHQQHESWCATNREVQEMSWHDSWRTSIDLSASGGISKKSDDWNSLLVNTNNWNASGPFIH